MASNKAGPTNQSFDRVKENLKMYGFGTNEEAIIQTIKELIENSLDALKLKQLQSIEPPKMTLKVSQHGNNIDWLQITVSDNGLGIENPIDSLSCYSSTKPAIIQSYSQNQLQNQYDLSELINSDNKAIDNSAPPQPVILSVYQQKQETPKFTGKFGLGLFCVTLFTTQTTGEPLRVTTMTTGSTQVSVADYGVNMDTQRIVILQKRMVTMNDASTGTRVTICLCKPPASTAYRVLSDIIAVVDTYLQRLVTLPTSVSVNFECTFPSEELKILKLYGRDTSNQNTNNPTSTTAATITQCNSMQYNTRLMVNSGDYCNWIKSSLNTYSPTDTVLAAHSIRLESSASEKQHELSVIVTCVLIESFGGNGSEGDNCDDENDDNEYFNISRMDDYTTTPTSSAVVVTDAQPQSQIIPLQLWRYANQTPLIDKDDDALSCSLTAALRSVSWVTLAGCRLNPSSQESHTHTQVQARVQQGQGIQHVNMSTNRIYDTNSHWQLEPQFFRSTGPATNAYTERGDEITVAVSPSMNTSKFRMIILIDVTHNSGIHI